MASVHVLSRTQLNCVWCFYLHLPAFTCLVILTCVQPVLNETGKHIVLHLTARACV